MTICIPGQDVLVLCCAVLCCRFVQSNSYLKFIERGGKLKYNEFGTARPAVESLPVIAAGLLGLGQGKYLSCPCWYHTSLHLVHFC